MGTVSHPFPAGLSGGRNRSMAGRSRSAFGATTLVALGALLAFSGALARAEALVSNIDLTDSVDLSLSDKVRVQEFTVGGEQAVLEGVEIKFSSGSADLDPPTATLRRWDGSTYVLAAELSGPDSLSTSGNEFTAPEDTTLQADTRYAVRLEGGGSGVALRGTFDDREGGRSGWRIRDESSEKDSGASTYEARAAALMIRVSGSVEPDEDGAGGNVPFDTPNAPTVSVSETSSDDGDWTVNWTTGNDIIFVIYIELEETWPANDDGVRSISTYEFDQNPNPMLSKAISGRTIEGDYGYRARACNTTCSVWSGTVTVSFETPNDRPVVSAISDQSVLADATATVAVTVTDDDSDDTHTVTASSDDDDVATASVDGKTLTVNGVSRGEATVEVTATDDSGADNAASAAVEFDVTVPNSRPVVAAIDDATVRRESELSVAVSVTDADAGDTTHTVKASSDASGVATVSESGNPLTVTGVSRGTATISVTATDLSKASNATSAAEEFEVTVPNSRPEVGAIDDATVSKGSTVTRTAMVTDGDSGDTHTVTASSDDTGLATVSVEGKTLTVAGVSCGTATISVTATDNSLESNDTSEAEDFDVTVTGSAPTVGSISDATVPQGTTATRTVSVTGGAGLTVSASSDDESVATVSVSVSGNTATLTLRGVARGTATISVTATDNCGTSAEVEFDVTVPNSRPVVGSISDLTVSRGTTRTESVTVTDGDSRDRHTVTATSNKRSVAAVSVNGKTLTVRGVSRGEATITVTAEDNSGESNDTSAAVTFTATVPNSRPVVSPISNQTVAAGASGTVTVVVTDGDAGDTHTVTASSDNTSVATVSVSGKTLTLFGVAAGSATITVTATDNSRASNATSAAVPFSVTVTAVVPTNNQPVVSPIADQTVMIGAAHKKSLPVTVTDADDEDTHNIEASSADATIASVAVNGSTLEITGVAAGSAEITVIATDDSDTDNAASAPVPFTARVNTRPVVGPLEAQSIVPGGDTVTVVVIVTDPDAGQEHEVEAVSGDSGVVVAEVAKDGTELTLTSLSAGSTTVTVTATDDSGADNAASEPVEFAVVSNTPPNAEDDVATTGQHAAVTIAVLANDTDSDGQTLSVGSATNGGHGTTAVSGDKVTYTPGSGFRGIDTFTYTVTDGVATDEATVWVWVDVLSAAPNPSYTGSYIVSWVELALPGRAVELWEATGGAGERVYFGPGRSKAFSRRPEGTYTYHIRLCDTEGDCLAMPEPHLEVNVMFSPVSDIVEANATGNVPYETGVTKGGDGYIHIPLVPVPGVNGLQPRLSFDYSGGRDRQRVDRKLPGDILGYGWHVGGFSAIRWCVTNQARTEIEFTRKTNLCLDGEPLVVAEGTHLNYDAEYRTSRETYAKITLRRSDTPGTGWFEVRMPDGTVREYGRTADSNLVHTDADGSRTFVWSVNKETDAFGNQMTYEYHEDETALARHPKRVAYGDGNGGDAEILFEYAGRGDIATVRAGGLDQVQWLRVHSVDIRMNGTTVRKYLLESKVTTQGWVRLERLQMCAYRSDGTQECPAPFVVKWMDIAQNNAVPIEKTCVSELADPLGVETKFTYETLTEKGDHDFLIHADDAPFGPVVPPVKVRALPATPSDDTDKGGNIKPIVTQVARTNGVGGEHVMKYAYLVEDGDDKPKPRGFESTLNWGFLGFYAIRETDMASGVATYTQYRLDYPHFGKPAAVARYNGVYSMSAETLSKRFMRYYHEIIRHPSGNKTDLPYSREATGLVYEQGTQLGATQTRHALTRPDGFVTELKHLTRAGHSVSSPTRGGVWGDRSAIEVGDLKRRTVSKKSFLNRTGAHWLIGFVNGETVTLGTGRDERTASTTLTPYDDTNAVDTATRFPMDLDLEIKTDHDYDDDGNRESTVVSGAHVDARTTSVGGFSAARYPTLITNAVGHVERLEHDARLGLPTKVTDANNRATRIKYDALGREVERVREWDGNATTTTSYDDCTMCDVTVASGKCPGAGSTSVKPAMVSETVPPLVPGKMSREAPTTRRYFDKLGRLIRTEVEAFSGDNPRRVDAFYDARGRLACESAPYHSNETPHYTRYGYDVRDRLTSVIRPDGGSTAIKYEAVAASHRVKATVTETVKEADGSMSETRQSARLYNILGELVEATDGSDRTSSEQVTTTYAIDTSGLLKTVTADGVATSFEYDAAGNRASVTNPDMGTAVTGGKSAKFEYTGLGQVRLREDGRGTTTYAYDLLGRPTSRVDPAGTGTVTADVELRPGERQGSAREANLRRDGVLGDLPVRRVRAAGGDDDGDPRGERHGDVRHAPRLRQPGPAVDHDVSVHVEGGARLQRARLPGDAHGRDDGDEEDAGDLRRDGRLRQHRGRRRSATARRRRGRSTRSRAGRRRSAPSRGMSTFQDHAYAWLTDGSLESRTARAAGSGTSARALRKEEFAYDHLGRLDSAATKLGGSTSASRTLDYAYDTNGNLTSKTSDVSGDKSVTATMYGQGAAGPHALTRATVGGVAHTFHYDAQGHLEHDDAASGDDRFIEWDGRGLAVKVTVGTAKDAAKPKARETFAYGPGGARYRKISEWRVGDEVSGVMKSETTHYVGAYEKRTRACTVGEGEDARASTQSVERTRVGPVLHVKTFACGSTDATTEIEYRHFDHLGSLASITNSAGSELVALAHDPHGERRKPDWTRRLSDAEIEALASDHPDRTSRGFTGHEHLDRTGLVHMNGRLYDPLLGRFLSPDPIVANPADGQQWNLYSYAGNSPLSHVDPSGLTFCDVRVCGGTDHLLPGGFPGGGGYSTRTVSGWGTYVTFGIYHRIVRIWRSSSSFNSWDAGAHDGGWSDDTFWEDVQQSVIYPIVHAYLWVLQVVERCAACEPASSVDIGFSIFEVDPDTGRIVIEVAGIPDKKYPSGVDPKDKEARRKYGWWSVPVRIKGGNNKKYDADYWCDGYPGGQSNCHGVSVAGGQVWIQPSDFRPILNDLFQTTTDLKEGNLVVWFDGQLPIHSAVITSVGSGIDDSLATGMLGARDYVETMTIGKLNEIYKDDSPVMYEPK